MSLVRRQGEDRDNGNGKGGVIDKTRRCNAFFILFTDLSVYKR